MGANQTERRLADIRTGSVLAAVASINGLLAASRERGVSSGGKQDYSVYLYNEIWVFSTQIRHGGGVQGKQITPAVGGKKSGLFRVFVPVPTSLSAAYGGIFKAVTSEGTTCAASKNPSAEFRLICAPTLNYSCN